MNTSTERRPQKFTTRPLPRNWPLESLIRINPIYARLAANGLAPLTARAMTVFLEGNLANPQATLILSKHLPMDLTDTKRVRQAFVAAIREA